MDIDAVRGQRRRRESCHHQPLDEEGGPPPRPQGRAALPTPGLWALASGNARQCCVAFRHPSLGHFVNGIPSTKIQKLFFTKLLTDFQTVSKVARIIKNSQEPFTQIFQMLNFYCICVTFSSVRVCVAYESKYLSSFYYLPGFSEQSRVGCRHDVPLPLNTSL